MLVLILQILFGTLTFLIISTVIVGVWLTSESFQFMLRLSQTFICLFIAFWLIIVILEYTSGRWLIFLLSVDFAVFLIAIIYIWYQEKGLPLGLKISSTIVLVVLGICIISYMFVDEFVSGIEEFLRKLSNDSSSE